MKILNLCFTRIAIVCLIVPRWKQIFTKKYYEFLKITKILFRDASTGGITLWFKMPVVWVDFYVRYFVAHFFGGGYNCIIDILVITFISINHNNLYRECKFIKCYYLYIYHRYSSKMWSDEEISENKHTKTNQTERWNFFIYKCYTQHNNNMVMNKSHVKLLYPKMRLGIYWFWPRHTTSTPSASDLWTQKLMRRISWNCAGL